MDQAADQLCLDSYAMMRPVRSVCGHVTEIHFNSLLLADEHFALMEVQVCAWCQLVAMPNIPPENLAHLLAKHHLHVNLYGEVCAFKVSELTVEEWESLQAMEALFTEEDNTDGE